MKSIREGLSGSLVVVVLAVLLPIVVALSSGVSFTLNGYDVDEGTDPICWRLTWWPRSEYLEFQNFRMMPACYTGTTVKIYPLDLDLDENVQVMHTQTPYTFLVEAMVDYGEIVDSFRQQELQNFIGSVDVGPFISRYLLFRIVLCDISKIGFCNPLALSLDFTDEELQDYETLTEEGWFNNVTENEVLSGKTIGNHIFSPWLNLTMHEVKENSYRTNITIQMTLPAGSRGSFFAIGHGHVQAHILTENKTDEFVDALTLLWEEIANSRPQAARTNEDETGNETNSSEGAFLWVEVADAIPDNVVDVRPPPSILTVSIAMKIGVGVTCGLLSLIALAIFLFIVVNRDHVVMKLAQWHFLAWLVMCCFVANVFVFTYMPNEDWHCRVADFIEFVPLTLIGTILIGRSWRVYVTVSAAMNIGIRRKSETNPTASDYAKRYCIGCLSFIAEFPYNCLSKNKERRSEGTAAGFRKQVTAAQTTRLILWLSLPQIIMQVCGMFFVDRSVEIQYNDMMTQGREICEGQGQWIRRTGVVLAAAAFGTAVLLAWLSRELPSAFNETDAIFNAATINTIVGLMAISLDQVADASETHPDVTVFLWSMTSLIVCWTAMGFIVIPKVRRVRSGEEVVISHLLAQNRQSTYPSAPQGLNNGEATQRPSLSSNTPERTIPLKRHQAIPKGLEQNMLGANKLLVGVRNELAEGRTPNLKEWEQLMGKVDELHNTFERLDFEWTEEDEHVQE